MKESEIVDAMNGNIAESADKEIVNQQQSKEVEKPKDADSIIESELAAKKKSRAQKDERDKEVEKLADAKNILKEIKAYQFDNDDIGLEAQAIIDVKDDIGEIVAAHKLVRLQLFDKASSALKNAKNCGLSDALIEALQDIVENKRGFDEKVAETTINMANKMLDSIAKANINSAINMIDLEKHGKNMSNRDYFIEQSRQRQEREYRAALEFFRGNR